MVCVTPYLSRTRCLLGVLVSAFRRLCVPVPVCPVSLGCAIGVTIVVVVTTVYPLIMLLLLLIPLDVGFKFLPPFSSY